MTDTNVNTTQTQRNQKDRADSSIVLYLDPLLYN